MAFFGNLFKLMLYPVMGRPYTMAWEHLTKHEYTKAMKLHLFQQLCSTLPFNSYDNMTQTNKTLHKIWPLLNIVKATLGAFVDLGSEVSLDKATVACRSVYNWNLIVFNPCKPTEKFHFEFYFLVVQPFGGSYSFT